MATVNAMNEKTRVVVGGWRFIPDRSLYYEPKEYTVKPKVFRKAAFDVLWFIGVVGILECLEAIQSTGVIPQLLQLY